MHSFKDKIVCFDLDGTLTKDGLSEVGEPIEKVVEVADRLKKQGYKVHINTSRTNVELDTNEVKNKTGISDVFVGKPVADVFIDDRGLLPPADLIDAVVENKFLSFEELVEGLSKGTLKSEYALNTYNAPENESIENRVDDGTFRVYVPMTGGMDSTTLFEMATESGYPVHPIYFDFGQPYAESEIKYASGLVESKGLELEVIHHKVEFEKHSYIMLGRNAIIIFWIAKLMKERGEWGEIWFGNLAGESPTYGGDKSRKFFNDTQMLLAYNGYNVRICNPLIGMDKPDEVNYWTKRNIKVLEDTVTCLSDDAPDCGHCQSCFKKWCAFVVNGVDIRDRFKSSDIKESFKPFVEKYQKVLTEAKEKKDYSHYSPAKIDEILSAIEKL